MLPRQTSTAGEDPLAAAANGLLTPADEPNEAAADGVAIIGMAARVPGAGDVDELWSNLCAGKEAVITFSDEELLAAGVDAALLSHPNYVRAGPVLDDIDQFDAPFFGVSSREAELTDPQHRLFLECAWHALEHAGYDPDRYSGRIGVYAGAGVNAYLLHLLMTSDFRDGAAALDADVATATDHLTTKVSYRLNLRGPSLSIQSACSTSLVAVHLACQSLLNGESDMMLAGGVTISLPQRAGYLYQEGMILSPDGHCRAFDAAASGTVGASGVGIVVLKRLTDALADGDTVYAVIRGSAINNDGAAKVGYTAPSVEGQAEVIAEALAVAGVDQSTIDYVEAHGTATQLGDPIEVEALHRVFGPRQHGARKCALGSVKTNLGHLDTAAGVVGLIKTALALHHRMLPPSLNFERPNPRIDFSKGPFFVNTRLLPWPSAATPRRAGVSSFGMGGTNAHVVLEEAPPAPCSSQPASAEPQVLVLSARSDAALERLSESASEYLRQHPALDLAEVAATLQLGRRQLPHRRVVVASSALEAADTLSRNDPRHVWTGSPAGSGTRVAFLFPGQGSQAVGMGRGLYATYSIFRDHVDECCRFLQAQLGLDLREVLWPNTLDRDAMSAQLDQTRLTQPALFVMEYALAQMWISLGVKPTALLGHSLGQYVAACLAGVLSLDDALGLVAERGRLMQALPPGAMLAVGLPEAEIMPLLNPELSLAAVNGPAMCVAAGSSTAITELQSRLEPRGVATHRLRTSHAFHSHMMDPVLEPFRAHVARARLRPPTLPIVSNVNGSWLGAEASTAEYWVEHLRQPVRFSEGLATLLTSQPHVLLEVGYGRTLANLARQHSAADVRSLRGVIPGLTTHDASGGVISLLETVGRLWLAGASINWPALHPRPPRRVPLPRYPFERRRYWAEPRLSLNDSSTFAPRAWEQPEGIEEASQVLTAKAHVGPRNETECAVAAVWAELLGIDRIDVRDDFLELGGTSLLAVQVAARLRQVFNVELPLRYFLEAPTVEAVSSRIEQERLESSDPEIVARLVGEIAQLSGAEVSQVLTAQVAAEPVAKRA